MCIGLINKKKLTKKEFETFKDCRCLAKFSKGGVKNERTKEKS